MGRREDAAALIKKGVKPSEIANKHFGVTYSTVRQYLGYGIGEGKIDRTDIILTFKKENRDLVESYIAELNTDYWFDIYKKIDEINCDMEKDDLVYYMDLRRYNVEDLFKYVMRVEIILHGYIRKTLENKYHDDWWLKGVPDNIKNKCIKKHGKPDYGYVLYSYTGFRDLVSILKQNVDYFNSVLEPIIGYDVKEYVIKLGKIVNIRNIIVHQVNQIKSLSDDDMVLVKTFYQDTLKLK